MTTRSFCISAAVLLLAMTLTWPAFPGQSDTEPYRQSELRSGRRKSQLQSTVTKKTDKSSPPLCAKGATRNCMALT